MLQRLRAAFLLAPLFAILTACGAAETDRPHASAPAGGDAHATVTLSGTSFSPAASRVRVGEVITWVWSVRGLEHDVVFDDGRSSPRQRTGTWQRTFDRPGTYKYLCTLHPDMTGHVVVE